MAGGGPRRLQEAAVLVAGAGTAGQVIAALSRDPDHTSTLRVRHSLLYVLPVPAEHFTR